jgi:hypothetical protein
MAIVVAVHQPNFFPWLGYFDKIRRADAFVFLDKVDYPRAGSSSMGSWVNRVKLSIQGEAKWITCPVKRMAFGSPILAAEIDDGQPWRAKFMRTLQANYGRAPRFVQNAAWLEALINTKEVNLATFNIKAVHAVAKQLGLTTRFLRQSELSHEGSATDLLVSLVQVAGGDTYLAGGGASGYQEDNIFAARGIKLTYQNFTPQVYGNVDRFLPSLSVIDYLMQDGRPLCEAFPD